MSGRLCAKLAIKRGYRFFLLGGEPGLAERARTKALARYPGLQIVGAHHGYFDPGDPEMVSLINAAAPDILWVGMGDPRQVLWTDAWRRHLKVPLVVTCGGMFKIVAEELERIPHRWRQRGFEWVYRLWQEPAHLETLLPWPAGLRGATPGGAVGYASQTEPGTLSGAAGPQVFPVPAWPGGSYSARKVADFPDILLWTASCESHTSITIMISTGRPSARPPRSGTLPRP